MNPQQIKDELLGKQKKERKALNTELSEKLKGLKGDARVEIEGIYKVLQDGMKCRHEEELNFLLSSIDGISIADDQPLSEQQKIQAKKDKAQKKRDKVLEKKSNFIANITASTSAVDSGSLRQKELDRILHKLESFSPPLTIKEIPSDGHCLYRALADQMIQKNSPGALPGSAKHDFSTVVKTSSPFLMLRTICGNYILDNQQDFLPFLDEGIEINDYVNKIKNTSEWGGQLELRAISDALNVNIIIVGSEGENVTFQGDKFSDILKGDNLVITFHRHYLSTGEHYNSTIPNTLIKSS